MVSCIFSTLEKSSKLFKGTFYIFALQNMLVNCNFVEKHPHSMMLPPPCFTVGMMPDGARLDAWHSGEMKIMFLMV